MQVFPQILEIYFNRQGRKKAVTQASVQAAVNPAGPQNIYWGNFQHLQQ